MQIESDQLGFALVAGNGAFQHVATVPPGERWILKDIRSREYKVAPGNQVAFAITDAGGVFVPVYDTLNEAVNPHWEGWSLMKPGDRLSVFAIAGDFVRLVASGTVLPIQ